MPYGLWMAAAIPVIAAGCVLHLKLGKETDKKWNILPKCLSTWMIVCTAAVGIYQHGIENQTRWIMFALFLFFLADGLLEIHFFTGMAFFAAGHLIITGWFIRQGHFTVASVPVWCVLMLGAAYAFRKELENRKRYPYIYLMLFYSAVLMAMVSIALTLPFMEGEHYIWPAVGAALFGISDMFVGKKFFGKSPPCLDFLALPMYYCGIFCLAMTTWVV
jgi:uncharacterized membrane protein YhhN